MTLIMTLALAGLASAAIPAAMFLGNRKRFQPPPDEPLTSRRIEQVSVLIPARDEAAGIADCVRAALESQDVQLEVIVLDDHSSDATAEIVRAIAVDDERVRLIAGQPLPADWNGKQYACHQLAQAARYNRLVFIDADVQLRSDALRRLIAYQNTHDVALLSAFPHQVTLTWLEKWLIPLMHFILLGFLPIARMRRSRQRAYAAGCGQLFVSRRSDYRQAGTHAAIRDSRHDGLKLPGAYRDAGLSTDVVDGTPIASCRMYRSAGEVLRGLLKNASEGIASPRLIVPFTSILLGGTVLPWIALLAAVKFHEPAAAAVAVVALTAAHLPRALAARQFQQSWQGVLFHTPAVALFIVLQWIALLNRLSGRSVAWRGRSEIPAT